ncbi:hypothetical protein POTOM_029822 [Populus tomentosa]|uniref:Importin N-terminal domain-containing protein n=1 Tax=Populus tomentosa TaxID=118781 RepID=A0A8X7ZBP9_POPTO|nr:hypothetical protein POTOM_029822 [Populus tomentosa]
MANLIDQDQEWLLNCLNATLDPNQEIRSLAEVSLRQASLQPGHSPLLLPSKSPISIQSNRTLFLQQFIKKHWHESEESFESPAVATEEKEVIRILLLPSLDDSHRKICTAISMAIASIAVYDWPENWPDLLPFLLKLINDRTNVSGVHGALRCLALLSGDLDDTVVPTLVPVLFPCLLTIVSSPQNLFKQNYDNYLRTKALTIVYSCVSVLGIMSGVYKTEIIALITPMLKPWMDQFSVILEPPMQPEDPDNWSLRMEVLKCLNQFVQNFPSLTESEFMVIVGPLWQTFVTSLSVYMRSSIECTEDPYGDRYDSDGAEKSLDAFVIQLFEFLLTIVGSAKLMKVVKNNIKELAYYTLAFLQMTEQQVIFYNILLLYVLVLLCYLMVIVDKCICLDIFRCLGGSKGGKSVASESNEGARGADGRTLAEGSSTVAKLIWTMRCNMAILLTTIALCLADIMALPFAVSNISNWGNSCLLYNGLSMETLFFTNLSCNKIRIVIPQSQKSRIVILNREISLGIVGDSQLKLKTPSIVILVIDLCEVHTWSRDANQFVADEDDATYSCRVSGDPSLTSHKHGTAFEWQNEGRYKQGVNLDLNRLRILVQYGALPMGVLLLEEVVNSFGSEGIYAIIDAMRERFNESEREKAAGSAAWWRVSATVGELTVGQTSQKRQCDCSVIRESVLFALADLSDQLLDAEASGMISVNLGNLVEQIVTKDVGTGVHEYPFLYARIFTSVAKFSSVISHGVLEHFLHAAIKGVGMNVPPPVKMGACQALSQLLPEANKENIQPQLMGLFSSLTDLLHQASDETLHLVLETLQASIKAVREAAVSFESVVSPVVLNTWALYVSDPFLSIDAIEVLEALKNAPGGIHPLVSRILPHIGPILNKPYQQPDGLVAGSLDLNAPSDVIKAIYDTCFDAVIRIVLQSDDHSEMQNATQCLASFISGGREEILSWAADSGFTMRSLLDAASRLLDPGLESSGSLFVGSYILQLILHLPLQMAMHIRDLVTALVRRMQSAQIVHMSVPHVEQFIDMLIGIPAEGYENSFVYVMSEWTQKQGEIQGAYQIKVTTSALALLLSTGHAELNKVNVLGHLKSAAGITTRSKAKLAPDQWTLVPLPVKILALLADTVIEFQEQAMADDEESDWEEIQGGVAESNDSLLSSAAAPSFGRTTYGQLEAMAKAYNENEEDWDDDDLLSVSDQLNGINLVNYLADFFAKFVHSNRQLFDHLCQKLIPAGQHLHAYLSLFNALLFDGTFRLYLKGVVQNAFE